MTSKMLVEVLAKYGHCEREGDVIRIGANTQVSVFATVGDETLTIHRVTQIELMAEVLIVTIHRGDLYAIAYEDVRALHFGGNKSKTGYGTAT